MARFRDDAHLYRCIGTLLERIEGDAELVKKLAGKPLSVRFRYHDPEAEITVILGPEGMRHVTGPCDVEPDVKIASSGDTAHRFWLGKLNAPVAIATGKVRASGSVPKALGLLPVLKPAFKLYPKVLEELGEKA